MRLCARRRLAHFAASFRNIPAHAFDFYHHLAIARLLKTIETAPNGGDYAN
jgi:hypothetical protein